MPTRANTGPRVGLTTHSGDFTTSSNGQTVSALNITGRLLINHDNVTVNDVQVPEVNSPNGADNVSINYCDISGMYIDATQCDGWTLTRCFFGDQTDDFVDLNAGTSPNVSTWCRNFTFDYCLWDGLQASTGDKHLDAIQILGADNVKLRHCVVRYVASNQATRDQMTGLVTMEYSWNGHVSNGWELSDCEFYGGGFYQLDMYGPNGQLLRNKFFSLADAGNGFTYGTSPMVGYPGYAYTQSGNTLDGAPFTGPTS
jgi:hypothetical protein